MRELWGLELKGGVRAEYINTLGLDEVTQENLSKNQNGHSALACLAIKLTKKGSQQKDILQMTIEEMGSESKDCIK